LGLALSALLGAWLLSRDGEPYFDERRGELAEVIGQSRVEAPDRVVEQLRLVSTSGLAFDLAIQRALPASGVPQPLVLIVGGHRTGRDAVRLLPAIPGVVIGVISYPYDGEHRLKGFAVATSLPKIRQALMDTPAALALALDHLLTDPSVDGARVELVGVSLGAPVAVVTGGWDSRFSRVWSVHGGGKLRQMIDFNLREEIASPLLRAPLSAFGGLLVAPLSPERFAARIAPRELVMINARQDEKIPRACVDALYAAAQEPKELIWLEGEHVNPRQEELIQELLELVLTRVSLTPAR